MKRREFIVLLGGAAAAFPLPVCAQQKKVYRIGFLETTAANMNAANLNSFRSGMQQLGYTEGVNYVIEYRSAEGRTERFGALAADLVRLKVDIIVPRGTPATLAAADATISIPIVVTAIAEPLGSGLVASLARPGRNVTGLSSFVTDLDAKRVELMKEMIPNIKRIAALMNMQNPNHAAEWKEIEAAAKILAIAPMLVTARTGHEIELAFNAAKAQQADAIVIGLDTLTQTNRQLIVELAARNRLPAVYSAREFVDAGGLFVYGASYPDLYRRAAGYVDKILKGTKAAELPVQQPTKFELVINLKTAKALGLTVPPQLLARADEVIE